MFANLENASARHCTAPIQVPTEPRLRPATEEDAPHIANLVNSYATQGLMLPRTAASVLADIGSFFVLECEGVLAACGGLRVWDEATAEVRSLAVSSRFQGAGLGAILVRALQSEATARGFVRLFALTLQPRFFLGLGWEATSRDHFPQKIATDCQACPNQHACAEICVSLDL